MDPAGYHELFMRHGVARAAWFRADMLDLVLDYARARLSEQLLTIDDLTDLQVLKHALHVREGEFVAHRPAEVSEFIQQVLEAIRADDRLAEQEESHLVGVQAVFDLSYDQFLALGRASLERAVASIDFRRAMEEQRGELANAASLARKREALAPVVWLTSLQRRSLGALY